MPGRVRGPCRREGGVLYLRVCSPGIDQTRDEKCHCAPPLGTRVLHGDCWRGFRSVCGGESCCSWSNQACRAWSEQAHVVIRGAGLHRAHAVRAMSTNAAGTFLSSDRPSCRHGDGNAVPMSFFDGELTSRVFLHSGSLHEGPRVISASRLR